jgi:hypothetical protein
MDATKTTVVTRKVSLYLQIQAASTAKGMILGTGNRSTGLKEATQTHLFHIQRYIRPIATCIWGIHKTTDGALYLLGMTSFGNFINLFLYILYYIFHTWMSTAFEYILIYSRMNILPYLGHCYIFLAKHELCVCPHSWRLRVSDVICCSNFYIVVYQ